MPPVERTWQAAYFVICALFLLPDRANRDHHPALLQRRALLHLHREDAAPRPRGLFAALVRPADFGMADPDPRATPAVGDVCRAWVAPRRRSALRHACLGTLAALGLSRPEMPSAAHHGDPDLADDRADHHHRDRPVLLLFATGLAHLVGVILAHATLGIPFVIITVTATLVGFDQSLNRAAASLGRRRPPPSSR